MKILLEQFDYEPHHLQNLLPDSYFTHKKNQKISVDWVGYYHDFEKNESLIILPKIFLDENTQKVFGSIPVLELLENNTFQVLKEYQKSKADIDFVYRFAFVFYLSLREFQTRKPENEITDPTHTQTIISNLETSELSEFDLIFSLVRFYQENRDLIIFKQKEHEKEHFKNTNWTKTINRQIPIVQNDTPIYLQNQQKHRFQDNENELLSIFFTVLAYFKTQYGFHLILENNSFQKYNADFDRKALQILRKIRHQYFQDKFKKLLLLLFAYFEKRESANTKKGKSEFVLCKDYNIVFEDMIDKLLSDKHTIDQLKNQADGKIVDHIFSYQSFFKPDGIFYIGDSKYYKESTRYSDNTIYKQHTYAKNVIQYNINLFHENEKLPSVRYRDELTEGYNITPNFFIQAYIDHQNITQSEANFSFDETQKPKISYHFENRIFDRDTLFVFSFRINFIFVLQSYLEKNEKELVNFAHEAKNLIRNQIWKHLKRHYDFFKVEINDIETFVQEHFRLLNGKMYRDSEMKNEIIIALEKDKEETNAIKNNILRSLNSEIL